MSTSYNSRGDYDKFFNTYDKSHRGYFESKDIPDVLNRYYETTGEHPSKDDLDNYSHRFKGDKEGRINSDEFYNVMNTIRTDKDKNKNKDKNQDKNQYQK